MATTRKLTRFQYAATLFGALAFVALAPATAHATDNEPGPGGGGCTYTDNDGYDVPIDEGQDVFVDGKIVSCRGGKIVITTAPQASTGGVRPTLPGSGVVVVNEPPKKAPVVRGTLPVLTAKN